MLSFTTHTLKAVLESPDAQMADTAGLQLSLSLAYSIYSLKEFKKMDLGVCLVRLSLDPLSRIRGTLIFTMHKVHWGLQRPAK